MRFNKFFISRKLLLLNIVLFTYVATNLIGGERGLVSYLEKKNKEKNLIIKKNYSNNKLNKLKKKNQLLSDKINLDYLDIILREKLKFGKKDEILIRLNQ